MSVITNNKRHLHIYCVRKEYTSVDTRQQTFWWLSQEQFGKIDPLCNATSCMSGYSSRKIQLSLTNQATVQLLKHDGTVTAVLKGHLKKGWRWCKFVSPPIAGNRNNLDNRVRTLLKQANFWQPWTVLNLNSGMCAKDGCQPDFCHQ